MSWAAMPGTQLTLWERACSRRGQYIRYFPIGLNIAFASKLAPTKNSPHALSQQRHLPTRWAERFAVQVEAFPLIKP